MILVTKTSDQTRVCVCCHPIYSGHQVYERINAVVGVTQEEEEGRTGFLHLPSAVLTTLIFLARRIQPFLSLVDREVEFCVPWYY